ncbi:DEAD/DEAH box helicase [Corynebacterium amycolatum]|uniref:DEAD/DEAH box helicase n=1 Tax=Corynebacterium amycolatum TaxID=43765 RepID=A0AB37GLF9_CORAY|nr:DEAD/DEAH box helicase [Corynebacterium amycolatum]QPR31886.1 DEAD/DEAH box helicase [Corynebacterium amycolatum]QQB83764.1 DEAD/DEAH box helicase [Corynebacterium amycolatum]
MHYTPHPYQAFTTNYIETHPQAAIILGMGMGKTIITLTAINNLIYDRFTVRKALIVAPLRVARDTWPQEINKWDHLTNLRTAVMVGDKHTREQALNTDVDIYITNRENIPWLVDHVGHDWPFDMVVIDELSSFKSHQAKRFKALRKMRPHINRIIGLTGTPAPNSLMDLWAQFALIDGGDRLGKFITRYRNQYFLPDKRNGAQIYTYKPRPGAEQEIYDAISDITVSMRTTDYLDLPAVTYTNHPVTLSSPERAAYDRLKKDMVIQLGDDTIDAANAAALSGKLQQLASGAIYIDDEHNTTTVHARKLDALEDLIEQANGATVLVAYWFKHEASRILDRFPQARALATSQDFADWNRGKIPVGLIHPASAGHGLNLQTGGHILVWMTTPWSLELYEQTNARLHRQGQTEPVSIIHLVATDTIDTRVGAALSGKSVMQDALVDAVAAELNKEKK